MSLTQMLKRGADTLLEATVVPSFTRVGPFVRRRMFDWADGEPDLIGRVVMLTGATSGLGRVAATEIAAAGATLVIVGRDESRTSATAGELRSETGNPSVTHLLADLADFDAVRSIAEQFRQSHDRLDALVHNAGALLADHTVGPSGVEVTAASQVAGPFLLTGLLLDRLVAASPGRVITMSSGGMYTQPLSVDGLEPSADDYRGTVAYARAKRAQVTLNEMWPVELEALGVPRERVVFHAMHPGWADTPGVRASLPTFAKVVGPLLRTPEEGADTLVWLAADDGEPLDTTGAFWLDRERRPIHRLRSTRRSDTPERRRRLWQWAQRTSGWSLAEDALFS